MNGFPILSVMLAVPLLAGLVCLLVEARLARTIRSEERRVGKECLWWC